MAWLPSLCTTGAPVAVIQNGVHQAARVAPYRAIPVFSYVYIEAQQGVYHPFAPPLDHFTVPADPSSAPFVNLFAGTAIGVRREPEYQTASWRKMLHNCVSNPLTALAGRGLEILKETLYREWAERILAEALPIAQADGAALSPLEPGRILQILASYPPGTRTSMLQDREQGKTLELSVLNGALIELGHIYNIPTTVNELSNSS